MDKKLKIMEFADAREVARNLIYKLSNLEEFHKDEFNNILFNKTGWSVEELFNEIRKIDDKIKEEIIESKIKEYLKLKNIIEKGTYHDTSS